jgi:hypothetical protein
MEGGGMTTVTIGANRAKLLEIARRITETFGVEGEHDLSIDVEDERSEWATLSFNNEDTDRDDWDKDLIVMEVEP